MEVGNSPNCVAISANSKHSTWHDDNFFTAFNDAEHVTRFYRRSGGNGRRYPSIGLFVLVVDMVPATGGIGLALAGEALRRGPTRLTLVARDVTRLAEARAALIESHGTACDLRTVSLDITAPYEEIRQSLVVTHDVGTVDVLINCAGAAVAQTFEASPPEVFDRLMRLNYLGAVHVTKALLPAMLSPDDVEEGDERGVSQRRIVFVSSLASLAPIYGFAAYAAAKAAITTFADILQQELEDMGPAVTTIFPPDTDTPGLLAGGLESPASVAASAMHDVLLGRRRSLLGATGRALSWATAGVSRAQQDCPLPLPPPFVAVLEVLLAPLFKVALLGFAYWCRACILWHDLVQSGFHPCCMEPAAGTPEFIEKLLGREFLDPEPFVDYKLGEEVNGFNLENEGFQKPIVITNKDGLRMKVPPSNFTLHDVVNLTDPKIPIDVIDVALQVPTLTSAHMLMSATGIKVTWSFQSSVHNAGPFPGSRLNYRKVFQPSSSALTLGRCTRPPHVVKELSLVDNCWSEPSDEDEELSSPTSSAKPHVKKYCLMSMAGSYTDFHIDFGGSSVWYHVLWGEKIFYLTPPRRPYLEAYWSWNGLFDSRHVFYPDTREPQIPVARLHLKAGETVLLPSGWIHAVYTPVDSLVFGGNFLTLFSIPLQLHVYRMEVSQETEERFLFPCFEKLHWYAADVILGRLTNYLYAGQEPPAYLLKAAHALVAPLRQWYELRKGLPKGERNYHLPPRTYLQYAYSTLITKLEDLVQSFLLKPSPDQEKRSRRSMRITSRQRSSSADDQSESTDPQVSDSGTVRYGALSYKRGREVEDEEDSVMDEVLDAVPELRSSRLVDDHYIFPISAESEETGPKGRASRRRRRAAKIAQKAEDPDPTWYASTSRALPKRRRVASIPRKGMTSTQTYPRPYNVSHPRGAHHSPVGRHLISSSCSSCASETTQLPCCVTWSDNLLIRFQSSSIPTIVLPTYPLSKHQLGGARLRYGSAWPSASVCDRVSPRIVPPPTTCSQQTLYMCKPKRVNFFFVLLQCIHCVS
uniref:JmjC domain-containing protein n=1 Tax=Echinococcus canadensis TaxID=519352 RepID=A0A915F0V9_9CEST